MSQLAIIEQSKCATATEAKIQTTPASILPDFVAQFTLAIAICPSAVYSTFMRIFYAPKKMFVSPACLGEYSLSMLHIYIMQLVASAKCSMEFGSLSFLGKRVASFAKYAKYATVRLQTRISPRIEV